MKFFSTPTSLSEIVAPLSGIAADLEDFVARSAQERDDNLADINLLIAKNEELSKESEKATKVRDNLRSFLGI